MTPTLTFVALGVGNAWPESCPDPFCPQCAGADRPLEGRGNTALAFVGGCLAQPAFCVWFDCGAGATFTRRRANVPLPDLLVLTHGHADHVNVMELDTILRERRHISEPLPVLCSGRTWAVIPPYLHPRLRHVAIAAGQVHEAVLHGHTVRIRASDAASHFPGGLVYRMEAASSSVAVLLDLKTWSAPLDPLEGLDLAIVEGNTLHPMSKETGHFSIVEALHLIRGLTAPPRLTLLTHHGHDDARVLSAGELIATLAALAPDLAVRATHRGMTIGFDTLPPRNPVAVLDEANRVVGCAEKAEVHERGLLHASVLILVADDAGQLVLAERHARMSYPGRLDCFGGHMAPADGGNPHTTALREATEEIRVFDTDGHRLSIDAQWLKPLGAPYLLESHAPTNRERSTVYGIRLPPDTSVRAFDEVSPGDEVELTVHVSSLESLREQDGDPSAIADGLARILHQLETDASFLDEVKRFLARDG